MTSRRIGNSDLEVGPIAYGCWRLSGTSVSDARAKIETAVDNGMTLIDTADIYGWTGETAMGEATGFGSAEELLGSVLAEEPSLRDRIVIATKGGIRPGGPYDSSRDYLRLACEASLRRLGVDVIDLYQIHRPDLLTHPGEVAEALVQLRESGKVREIGVSNYSASQIRALQAHLGEVPLVSTQPELSLLHLDSIDDGVLDHAMARHLTPLAWSPLAGGRVFANDAPTELSSQLAILAERESVSATAIALAWIMALPSVPIPIIGTQSLERIIEASRATSVRLSRADWYSLTAAAGRDLP